MISRLTAAIAVTAAALCAATVMAAAADPGTDAAVGRWRTPEDSAVVEVQACGGDLCGYIVTSDRLKADPMQKDVRNKDPALRGRAIKGVALFEHMTGGSGVWKGKVYNPADGGLYAGSVRLIDPDTLKLEGCLTWPLCKSQTWRRLR